MNKKARELVYSKYNGRCAYCGCELNGIFQADHLIPKEHFDTHITNNWRVPEFLIHLKVGDKDHLDNMMPACGSCNNYKNSMDLETFRTQIGLLLNRLNERFTQYKIAKRFGFIKEDKKEVKFYYEQAGEGINM